MPSLVIAHVLFLFCCTFSREVASLYVILKCLWLFDMSSHVQTGCSYEEGLVICRLMVCTWLTVRDLTVSS